MILKRIRIRLWIFTSNIYPSILRHIYKVDIGEDVRISYKAHIEKNINPKGLHIGDRTTILGGAIVLAHDHCRALKTDTYIGCDCVIGTNSIILPGVHIGDQTVIGAGAVVTKDIPSNSIAVGNPAKAIKTSIHVKNGIIVEEA